ncbi:MAG: hypothetical protein IR164_11625 [Devosia sp.]|jgi:hypothetical protein|uniref:hypothetical protein n=1 Tax=unclassified Devosia TaxID=196773 RepID=UPI001A070317|nr:MULTISPECIES: hypothetical protein [unclassified Devosia]MBF0679573.1 hypothetical protein [Devosia sp.]WEJ33245.1 hypothetical protein NYQ88_20740 [Devosia sp. SD17-2]
MKVQLIAKLATVSVMALTLAGCIDVEMEVALSSDATARATTTQIVSAEFYEMVSMSDDEGAEDGEEAFCAEGTITETDDGGAICVEIKEGPFADLAEGDDDNGMVFTAEGPNLVRVTLPMNGIEQEVGAGEEMDEETRAMMTAMFEGRTITLSISGEEILETNMDKSSDGKSATVVLDFMDIFDGKTGLEADLFALVRTP